jgi:hypothetical protein
MGDVTDEEVDAEIEDGQAPPPTLNLEKLQADAQARCDKMAAKGRSAQDIAKTYSGFVVGLMGDSVEQTRAALSTALYAEADRRAGEHAEEKGPYARGRLAAQVVAKGYNA